MIRASNYSKPQNIKDLFEVRVASGVLVSPKLFTIHPPLVDSWFYTHPPAGGFSQFKQNRNMEQKDTVKKYKGGRPKKAVKKAQVLHVKCSSLEKTIIK